MLVASLRIVLITYTLPAQVSALVAAFTISTAQTATHGANISSPKNAKKANTSDDELPAHLRKKKAPVKILDDYLTREKGPYLWPNDKGTF